NSARDSHLHPDQGTSPPLRSWPAAERATEFPRPAKGAVRFLSTNATVSTCSPAPIICERLPPSWLCHALGEAVAGAKNLSVATFSDLISGVAGRGLASAAAALTGPKERCRRTDRRNLARVEMASTRTCPAANRL